MLVEVDIGAAQWWVDQMLLTRYQEAIFLVLGSMGEYPSPFLRG